MIQKDFEVTNDYFHLTITNQLYMCNTDYDNTLHEDTENILMLIDL